MSCGVVWVGNGGKFICTLVYGVRRCSTYLPSWDLLLFVLGGCFGGGGGNVGLHGDLCV